MKRVRTQWLFWSLAFGWMMCVSAICPIFPADPPRTAPTEPPEAKTEITLPEPRKKGPMSVEEALEKRRSWRAISDAAIPLADLAQLLWAAQGVTNPAGYRTAPSAGALYPLEVYVAAGNVADLQAGLYHYLPETHGLVLLNSKDVRSDVASVTASQEWVGKAGAVIIITGVTQRTAKKYGTRAARYVYIEAGHAAQNICLQVTALGLATVTVGAFDDQRLRAVLRAPEGEEPLYLLPVGHPRHKSF